RDPMAMRPFIGYHVGDYVQHWLDVAASAPDPDKLPKIFYVNWFRKDADGRFLWPGFGDNSRVLKWIVDRLEGRVDAVESPVGLLPQPGDIDTSGLDVPSEDMDQVLAVRPEEWAREVPLLEEWFETFGEKLPEAMARELDRLRREVGGTAGQQS
ncbi:MAG TPA: phosphoenolpyruvate carboxykinase domain-containing protein, partial [Propionibacteriaceae bacterium]|nr:phosphoenolpyruvate carboxykinase domain-containing protein [Propionibacteriaceae bacterium]